ncbi:MAG: IS1182 family transposase [Bacilli bacterium]
MLELSMLSLILLTLPNLVLSLILAKNLGQKPYHTNILLKIHIYCFFNGIQSSRKQERECTRNIELIWLTGNLKPDHSTLSIFCKNNSSALKNVFKSFSELCRSLNLYDFKIFAFDGTKIKANCSKKRAFTIDKINKALANIDEKISEYIDKIDDDTSSIDESKKLEFQKKLDLIKQRKIEYSNIKQKMIDENLSELCLTDPDAKVMKNHSNIEPCYNVQSVVDSKNKLIIDYDVTNQANDIGLLKPMSDKLFEDYELDSFLKDNPNHIITEIADAGYYKSDDLLAINSDNINALVPKPKTSNITGDNKFSKDNFSFIPEENIYICPVGNKLTFSRKSTETRNGISNKYNIYSCSSCLTCPYLDKCTKSIHGRSIKRNVKEDKLLEFDNKYKSDSSFYKLRKALVEHPFGTIKRALGLTHVYIKGLERVSSWTSSVFLAYNLKRVINIMGTQKLIEKISTI